jgi:hypothetical protein
MTSTSNCPTVWEKGGREASEDEGDSRQREKSSPGKSAAHPIAIS